MTPALRILATAPLALALAGCDRSDAARAPAPPPASQPVVASASGQSADVVSCPLDIPSSRIARMPVDDVHEIAANYTHLTRVTKEPVYIDPDLSAMCAAAAPAPPTTTGAARYGPHDQTAVTIYMNASAADAFAARPAGTYPVGSVIVKEKKAIGPAGHSGVGGMVKRPAGYDPQHGDWEYFYFQDPAAATAKIDSGKIATCVRCHSGAASKDYVYGDWAPAATTADRPSPSHHSS